MIKKTIRFIHDLKVFFLAIIFISFLNILGANPIDISSFIGANFSHAIGMSTSVPENPFNKLAAQLKVKEEKLASKERELKKLEEDLDKANSSQDVSIILIAIAIFILFIMISVNFAMDFKKRRNL